MRACLEAKADAVLFGLLRMGFGEGRLRRTKYIFVHASGAKVSAVARGRLAAVRPAMLEAFNKLAACSVSLETCNPEDLNLDSVIERVRRASVVDDEVIEGDNAAKNVFTVEAFRQALAEERKALESSPEAVEQERIVERLPGSDKTVEEVLKLLHAAGGPLNWALFGLSGSCPRKSPREGAERRTSQLVAPDRNRSAALSPNRGAKLSPRGGYVSPRGGFLAAQERTRNSEPQVPAASSVPLASADEQVRQRSQTVFAPSKERADESDVRPERPPLLASLMCGRRKDSRSQRDSQSSSYSGSVHSGAEEPEKRGAWPLLAGPLLKKSGNWFRGWQLRWCEVGDGCLRWWECPEDASSGKEPKGIQVLQGMKVKFVADAPTQFSLETANGKDKVYLLDANAAAVAAKAGWAVQAATRSAGATRQEWIKNLEKEMILRGRQRSVAGPGTEQQ